MAQQSTKKKKPVRRRPRASLLTKLLILILLVAMGWHLHTLRSQVERAQSENLRYADQVEAIRQENQALEADIAEGSTQEKMEEIARDELDWAYADEYVFYDKGG